MGGCFRPKRYFRPDTVEDVISLLAKYGEKAKIVAGGTDLLVTQPPGVECLVDIINLPLHYIQEEEESIKIGALVTFNDIIESGLLDKEPYRVLVEAAREIGFLNIRHLATIGGNICNAAPSADSAPPLIALDAKVGIAGSAGERTVSLDNFFVDAGKTVLTCDELLKEFIIPRHPEHTGAAFLKTGRTRVDIALVNVATKVNLGQNDVCEDSRIVLGSVAPTPIRIFEAEKMLKNKKTDENLIEQVAQTSSERTSPISDVRCSASYRKKISETLVKRCLTKSVSRARGL